MFLFSWHTWRNSGSSRFNDLPESTIIINGEAEIDLSKESPFNLQGWSPNGKNLISKSISSLLAIAGSHLFTRGTAIKQSWNYWVRRSSWQLCACQERHHAKEVKQLSPGNSKERRRGYSSLFNKLWFQTCRENIRNMEKRKHSPCHTLLVTC